MLLEQTPSGKAWLSQFLETERKLALALLRRIRLVTYTELQSTLHRQIDIAAGTHKRVALFPVKRIKLHTKERTITDSSATIARILEDKSRLDKRRFFSRPTKEFMRQKKITCIIYVDDTIGTGSRVKNFWLDIVPKYVKSWNSYNKCQLKFVSFAAAPSGIANLISRKTIFFKSNIFYSYLLGRLELPNWASEQMSRDDATKFCSGFRGGNALIAFEHGVPNNMPGIFWHQDAAAFPLFPNRAIPKDVMPCFRSSKQKLKTIQESLADAGFAKVALETTQKNLKVTDAHYLGYLALRKRGYSQNSICNILAISFQEHFEFTKLALESEHIIEIGGKESVTEQGSRFQQKYGATILTALKVKKDPIAYIPKQFSGKPVSV